MTKRMACLLVLMSCAVLVSCAGGQRLEQHGPTVATWGEADIKFMRDTPVFPPRWCYVTQLVKTQYVKAPQRSVWQWLTGQEPEREFWTCPASKRELQLDTWEAVELKYEPSPFRVATPGVMNTLGFVAGGVALGKTMPRTQVNTQANHFEEGAVFNGR